MKFLVWTSFLVSMSFRVRTLRARAIALVILVLMGLAPTRTHANAWPGAIVTGPGPVSGNESRIRLFDGAGNLGEEFVAYAGSGYGARVAVCDVDFDNTDEIVTGPGTANPNSSQVGVFEPDGTFIRSFTAFGGSDYGGGLVVAGGNVDGIGADEILTGAGHKNGNWPIVRIWKGDGTFVSEFNAYPGANMGVNVAAGDLDGNGTAEIVTGPGPNGSFTSQVGIWSAGGSQLGSFEAYGDFSLRYGVNVAAGDFDGDGDDEIITGPGPNGAYGSLVRVWERASNFTFSLDASFEAYGDLGLTYGVGVGAGDVDGDGDDEIVTGPGPNLSYGSLVRVWERQVDGSFSLIESFEAYEGCGCGGVNVAVGGFGHSALTGKVYDDLNANCSQNAGEPGLGGRHVRLDPGARIRTTASDGSYAFNVLVGTYTLTLLPRNHWEQTCPTNPGTHTVTVSGGQACTHDFGSRRIPGLQDLCITVGAGRARQGFPTTYVVNHANIGNTSTAATAQLKLPPQVSYTSSAPVGVYDPVANTVTWSLGTLAPDDAGLLTVEALVPPRTNRHTSLYSSAAITPLNGDADPENNNAYASQEVVGSYDPNEKRVDPPAGVPEGGVLAYHIDFQNVGTAEATNVVVLDTLDTNIDISTLVFGATSHACTIAIEDRTILWSFLGIDLPDSTSNEPGSHGFAEYTVYPIAGLAPETELSNGAAIYFDFNEPIFTNVVTNFILAPAGVDGNEMERFVGLRWEAIEGTPGPGPFGLRLVTEDSTRPIAIDVHDAAGRLVHELETVEGVEAPSFVWDGSTNTGREVPPGVYFVRATQLGRAVSATTRIVIVR